MKTVNVLIASFALTMTSLAQADPIAKSPRTAASDDALELISKVEYALTTFVDACSANDAQRVDSVTTDDVRMEYALETPGTYYTLDAISLSTDCGMGMRSAGSHVRNLWIYPTNDAATVFVEYAAASDAATAPVHRQLALVEMRGEKIARLRNFSGPPAVLISAQGASPPSLSANSHSRETVSASD